MVICCSERLTAALHSTFWISTEVDTVLFSYYMAGAMWNCCCLSRRSVCTSLQCHFIWSHIHRMHVCLAVTCHLHFWLSNKETCLTNNILHATAVTWGRNRYRNKSQHGKLTLEKNILLLLLCDKALWWCQLAWWTWCTMEAPQCAPQWCFNARRPWCTMQANNWLTVSTAVSFFALQLLDTTLTKTSVQSTEENKHLDLHNWKEWSFISFTA